MKYHKIHHQTSYSQLTYQDTNKGHVIEHIIQSCGLCIIPIMYGGISYSIVISSIFIGIRGLARHDIRLVGIIGNHHILHHKYLRYNYGEYWLDYIGGTLCPYEK
jgi:sterol desaturase/sphingolipid hydroxylase (fatty acid hydroxylase superfamily)